MHRAIRIPFAVLVLLTVSSQHAGAGNASPGTSDAPGTDDQVPAILESLRFTGEEPASLQHGDLRVEVTAEPSKHAPSGLVAVVTGRVDDETVLQMSDEFNGLLEFSVDVKIVRLDHETSWPQVVLVYYTGGAHCCAQTKIATADATGRWTVIEGESLDGETGYRFKDVNGDGHTELISYDQSFFLSVRWLCRVGAADSH